MKESKKRVQRVILVILGLIVFGLPARLVVATPMIGVEAEDVVEFETIEEFAESSALTSRRTSRKQSRSTIDVACDRAMLFCSTMRSTSFRMFEEYSGRNGYGGPLVC